jgi:predicted alpha/beta superfamily hydrolase
MDESRMLYISLPEGYETVHESYPVVYQLYAHFTHQYFFPAERTIKLMGSHGRTPRMIRVGVKNRAFRYRDLLPEDHYGTTSEIDTFLAFFEEELIPFIDKNNRTEAYRVLSGPQAGASFGIYALSKKS